MKLSVLKWFYLILAGSVIAMYFEITALQSDRRQYSELMPILPVLGVGLFPFLQMLILPVVSIRLGLEQIRIKRRSSQRPFACLFLTHDNKVYEKQC